MLSPRTSRDQKENSSPNVRLSQTRKICMKVTKTVAKRSTKATSRPASCLPRSLPTPSPQDRAPCWKPQARAPQPPGEGSPVVPAGSSSARHPPCRLRPGNGKTRAPWQSTTGTHEEERGKNQHSGPIRALQPIANVNCTRDRLCFLLQL